MVLSHQPQRARQQRRLKPAGRKVSLDQIPATQMQPQAAKHRVAGVEAKFIILRGMPVTAPPRGQVMLFVLEAAVVRTNDQRIAAQCPARRRRESRCSRNNLRVSVFCELNLHLTVNCHCAATMAAVSISHPVPESGWSEQGAGTTAVPLG